MLSPRLLSVASFIEKDQTVLDIGTDHGYLPIYLKKNKLCKGVIASDVSKNALSNAEKNIEKANVKGIKLYLSDGLSKIDSFYDTITISGMGSATIISILKDNNLPDNIILSSNNNLLELRSFMNSIGYKIDNEVAVLDAGKYYDIISYKKGNEHLQKRILQFGKAENKEYFKYLYNKNAELLKKVNFSKKIKLILENNYLKHRFK